MISDEDALFLADLQIRIEDRITLLQQEILESEKKQRIIHFIVTLLSIIGIVLMALYVVLIVVSL